MVEVVAFPDVASAAWGNAQSALVFHHAGDVGDGDRRHEGSALSGAFSVPPFALFLGVVLSVPAGSLIKFLTVGLVVLAKFFKVFLTVPLAVTAVCFAFLLSDLVWILRAPSTDIISALGAVLLRVGRMPKALRDAVLLSELLTVRFSPPLIDFAVPLTVRSFVSTAAPSLSACRAPRGSRILGILSAVSAGGRIAHVARPFPARCEGAATGYNRPAPAHYTP